jgi:hypothetical protein
MRTYKESGIVPAGGALMTAGAGCVAGLLLGAVYSFTFYYIPYVYLNFLLAVGFGAGVGLAVGYAAREGKIRNVPVVGCLGIFGALVGIYAEWSTTAYAMTPMGELKQQWQAMGLWTFLPQNVLTVMRGLFNEGSWGLSEGSTVHGWPLVALWIVEAGLIVALAISFAVKQVMDKPFCEPCQDWVGSQTPHLYVGDGCEAVWSEVQHGTFENLALTPRATGMEPSFVRLTLACCERCNQSNFLSIAACQNTTDGKGNARLVERSLATNVVLDATQVEIVQAANWAAPEVGSTPMAHPAPGDWSRPQVPTPLA